MCHNRGVMATVTAPAVTALQAQAAAFLFLNDRLPDRIAPDQPHLDEAAQVWRVPVILAYPRLGVLGQVGEILVSLDREEVISHTPVEEMRAAAWSLVEQHRESIEAPLS
jgi:hypothetical protein